jgi:hypothetical protein
MIHTIECVTNDIRQLSRSLQGYAFTQDSAGRADLTVGKKYTVYGYRKNKLGIFYLTQTDTMNLSTPWWMPSSFFKEESITPPEGWTKKTLGFLRKDIIFAPKVYFEAIERHRRWDATRASNI